MPSPPGETRARPKGRPKAGRKDSLSCAFVDLLPWRQHRMMILFQIPSALGAVSGSPYIASAFPARVQFRPPKRGSSEETRPRDPPV